MSKSTLHLRLDKWIEDTNLSEFSGVKTNIYGHKSKDATLKSYYDLSIPVGHVENYHTISLDPGSYTVECVLPSGEVVSEDIHLKQGEEKYVNIESSHSPREYLSLQHYYGNVLRQKMMKSYTEQQSFNINKVLKTEFSIKTQNPKDFDTRVFLNETFGSRTNDVWQNTLDKVMIKEGEFSDEVVETVEMMDEIMLDGLVEISEGTYTDKNLKGEKSWNTLLHLIGNEAQDEMTDLMTASYHAKNKTDNIYSFKWIEPKLSYDVNIYELERNKNVDIRNLLLWTPSGAEYFTIPAWWRDSFYYDYVPIEIMVDISSSPSDFRSGIAVKDPSLSSAIAYLLGGSLPTAGKFVQKQAKNMLHAKVKNPYSAALGAYILMETRYNESVASWKEWVTNLYNWFPWLPDSGILKAWLHIEHKEWDKAKSLLTEAYQKGLPLYTFALEKLLEGLKLFDDDNDVKKMIRTVRKIAWRSNSQQLFTIIRLGLPQKKLKS